LRLLFLFRGDGQILYHSEKGNGRYRPRRLVFRQRGTAEHAHNNPLLPGITVQASDDATLLAEQNGKYVTNFFIADKPVQAKEEAG
jgi:ribosomal protein L27